MGDEHFRVSTGDEKVVGVSLWLIYGFIKDKVAIIVTNAVTLALGAASVCMKLRLK